MQNKPRNRILSGPKSSRSDLPKMEHVAQPNQPKTSSSMARCRLPTMAFFEMLNSIPLDGDFGYLIYEKYLDLPQEARFQIR